MMYINLGDVYKLGSAEKKKIVCKNWKKFAIR